MANEPTTKPQEQPIPEKQVQAAEKAAAEQQTGAKVVMVKLTVTAAKGAPAFVAGLHFPEGKEKNITVTPERAALLRNTTGYTVKEIK